MNAIERTPDDLLRTALSTDPSGPLMTYYDDATGERVELSATTLANWVAKTANLLESELSAEPGDRLAVLLPTHWQTAVWLLACAATGVVAQVGGDPARADLVVSGPETLEEARACRGERVALSLRPLGARFAEQPSGFLDYAVEAPSQPDAYARHAPVAPGAAALVLADGEEFTGGQVVQRAVADAEELALGPGSRVLTSGSYGGWPGLSAGLYAPLAAGASVVLCPRVDLLDTEALAARQESERTSVTV
ncbi:TIGR03089 family protein [Streptomyces xiaopingdaonensis]|uniref:TIGR03089 family protein n=1 Tax=Streptomyces xiaopingdaonensis TaxID=1565415 RepID=UPI0002FF8961|nr:TIGR03089 family protein [Streptomyces xiaopingdaonensis]